MDATLTVDTSPFSQIDRRFLHVLFASLMVHAAIAIWVNRQPHTIADDSYESVPIDRFLRAPLLPIPKNLPPVKLAPQAPRPNKPPGGPRPEGPRPALPGLLMGAVNKLTGRDNGIDAALSGAQRGNVDTTVLASRRERGPQETQAIGPVVTRGSEAVGLGEHVDVPAAKGRVDDLIIDDPAQLPDPELFMRFINSRRTALAACYERELKYHRSLKGRVTVRLTVAADGRAREVSVDQGSLGSPAVSDCIESLVRRWIFPVKPGDELPLQFPVLFTPAQ